MRKLVTALILVPLAILFATFAVANRQTVVISFDPFDQAHPAFALALPLFVLILVIAGVVVGGIAAWVRQGKWRRAARLADAQARALRAEVERLRRMGPSEVIVGPRPLSARPVPPDYGPRLTIPPPAA